VLERQLLSARMAKPIAYFQKHWAELVLFLDDGRIDLDTSSVDRMFKSTTLLHKNDLFMGSDEDAKEWCILWSIVGSCKLNVVDVEQFPNSVLS